MLDSERSSLLGARAVGLNVELSYFFDIREKTGREPCEKKLLKHLADSEPLSDLSSLTARVPTHPWPGACFMEVAVFTIIMKSLKYLLTIAAVTSALTLSAKADLQFLGAINFGNGPNDPDTNHDVLEAFLGSDPGPLNHNYETGTDFSQPVDVLPGEYFVVHYGTGKGGTGDGGSWEFFQVINGETSVTFPAFGNGPTNPDPFGHGGISSARGFGGEQHVPDSGTTAMLLGSAITGLGLVRRYLKR